MKIHSCIYCICCSGTKSKPKRLCPLCEQRFTHLRLHLQGVKHKDHPTLKKLHELMSLETKATGKEKKNIRLQRLKEVERIKKEGIIKANKLRIASNPRIKTTLLESERQSIVEAPKVVCSVCHGTFNERYFYKHKRNCASDRQQVPEPKSIRESEALNEDYSKILKNMQKDEFFEIIENDSDILYVGKKIYDTCKPRKERITRKKARQTMRQLAKLKCFTKLDSLSQLFHLDNLDNLEKAIKKMTHDDGDDTECIKPGLKANMGNMIKQTIDILLNRFLILKDYEKVQDLKNFQKVFTSSVYYQSFFGDAQYMLEEKSQKETRLPKSLPIEEDFQSVIKKTQEAIQTIQSIQSHHEFVWARQLVFVLGTLLNGKRGSECEMIEVDDWVSRNNWIDTASLRPEDTKLLEEYGLLFFMGKKRLRKGLTPIIFPKLCHNVLDMLADEEIRLKVGVNPNNKHLFAYTEMSPDGALGYNELNEVCKKFNIPKFNATAVRHRAISGFWDLPMQNEQQILSFLDYVGHDYHTDKNIYACPPALPILRSIPGIFEGINKV